AQPDHADRTMTVAGVFKNTGDVLAYGNRYMCAESRTQAVAHTGSGLGIVLGPNDGRPLGQAHAGQHDMPLIRAAIDMDDIETLLLQELAQLQHFPDERQGPRRISARQYAHAAFIERSLVKTTGGRN